MFKSIAHKLIATQSDPLQAAIRTLWDEIRIARLVRHSRSEFAKLKGWTELRVHLGCGPELKNGWLNIDLNLHRNIPVAEKPSPQTLFIDYDLRLGSLPLESGSAAYFYSSHFLEHLEYQAGVRLMRDCHRILRSGGIFRAALPDFGKMFRAYIERDHNHFSLVDLLEWLPDREPETVSLIDNVNLGVYQRGEHKCIYDEEKILLVLRRIGFASVEITPFKEIVDPDNEIRRRYSFYVEAVK